MGGPSGRAYGPPVGMLVEPLCGHPAPQVVDGRKQADAAADCFAYADCLAASGSLKLLTSVPR